MYIFGAWGTTIYMVFSIGHRSSKRVFHGWTKTWPLNESAVTVRWDFMACFLMVFSTDFWEKRGISHLSPTSFFFFVSGESRCCLCQCDWQVTHPIWCHPQIQSIKTKSVNMDWWASPKTWSIYSHFCGIHGSILWWLGEDPLIHRGILTKRSPQFQTTIQPMVDHSSVFLQHTHKHIYYIENLWWIHSQANPLYMYINI